MEADAFSFMIFKYSPAFEKDANGNKVPKYENMQRVMNKKMKGSYPDIASAMKGYARAYVRNSEDDFGVALREALEDLDRSVEELREVTRGV